MKHRSIGSAHSREEENFQTREGLAKGDGQIFTNLTQPSGKGKRPLKTWGKESSLQEARGRMIEGDTERKIFFGTVQGEESSKEGRERAKSGPAVQEVGSSVGKGKRHRNQGRRKEYS